MIELTPLDVRKKRGDFRRIMRGFDPAEVDSFLELVAERMESLVKENLTLKERAARLQDQVREQGDREKAVQEALVTAQELRKDISGQAQREAELMKREAESEIERMLLDAEQRAEGLRNSAVELERRRRRFLRAYHQYLERELDEVDREAGRHPLDEPPLELELDGLVAADLGDAQPRGPSGGERPDPTDEGGTGPGAAAGDEAAGEVEPTEALQTARDLETVEDLETVVDLEATGDEGEGGNGRTVAVESLAPEPGGDNDDTTGRGWPNAARMRTKVSSDRAGDPDGL